MITKNDIIQMARHVVKRGRGIPDRRIMHPARDWFIGLSLVSVFFIVGVLYAQYFFFNRLNDTGAVDSVNNGIERYDQKLVIEVLNEYENKSVQFDMLRSDTSNVVIVNTENIAEDGVETKDENVEDKEVVGGLIESF